VCFVPRKGSNCAKSGKFFFFVGLSRTSVFFSPFLENPASDDVNARAYGLVTLAKKKKPCLFSMCLVLGAVLAK